ncbi:glycoprotein 3-alpha-L-fucosyltransferase A-like [Clytia hemisphaerica]
MVRGQKVTINLVMEGNSEKKTQNPLSAKHDISRMYPAFSYNFHLTSSNNLERASGVFDLPNMIVTDRIFLQSKTKVKMVNNKTLKILLYFYDKTMTDEKFQRSQCSVKNCRFVRKPRDYETADAVLFKDIPEHLKRPVSKPGQLWVYYQLESPVHTRRLPEKSVFNWTATYRPDSTVEAPYGKFGERIFHRKMKLRRNYAKGKTKNIAWFVSNCDNLNGRMKYVRELRKYIDVDIYGDCGNLTCDRDSVSCMRMLQREYRFYLAFENSNCRHYITEKFFKTFSYDVIPIVMGAPLKDYQSIAPTHSFIHVDQYNSPQSLARYLHQLSTDDSMYNKYFEWKKSYELIDTNFMCRLCVMLHTTDYVKTQYRNLTKWWREKTCLKPLRNRKEFWTKWTEKEL